MNPEPLGYTITELDVERMFVSISSNASRSAFKSPDEHDILPNTEFARQVHYYTMNDELSPESETAAVYLLQKPLGVLYKEFWQASAFHWKTAALFYAEIGRAHV